MKSIEDTQALWDEYMELCRKCDLMPDDQGKDRERRLLMEQKILLLKKIRGAA